MAEHDPDNLRNGWKFSSILSQNSFYDFFNRTQDGN